MVNYKELVDILNENLKDYSFSIRVCPWYSGAHVIDVQNQYSDEYVVSKRYLDIVDDVTGESIAWINRYRPIKGGTVVYNPNEVDMKTRPYMLRVKYRLRRKYRGA